MIWEVEKMIHKYYLMGHYIVLDVYSGAVHLVDRIAFRLLDFLAPPLEDALPADLFKALESEFAASEIAEAYAELRSLYKDGALFSEDGYGLFEDKLVPSPVKALCLNISHDCNLRCAYCFAGKGDYDQGRMLMSAETGKKAIDYLIARSQDRENLEVDFFGGEPLLNLETVKAVVEYARSREKEAGKNFRFTITTNGLALCDETIDFINREMSNVVLSLDGRKEVNDQMRRRIDGSGSFDAILPKFQKLVAGREGEYYLRGTFTSHNLDFAQDVAELYRLGFDQVSVEPVVAAPSADYAIGEGDLPAVYAEYERLANFMLEDAKKGGSLNFFHFMLDLSQGPCAIKRLRGCGSGNEYLAITPDGDVYPCHQFVGLEEWKMGSVHDDSLDSEKKAFFAAATVYQKPDCKDCWAKYYCSGGCGANNYRYMGGVLAAHTISCEMEKKRLECAIALKAALASL